jgi:NAD(P)H-dependent FMN reductase
VLSASPGGLGGVRAQLAWLPTLTCIGARVMHAPEFLLSNAGAAFAADGSLADADMARRLRTWLDAFATWSAPTR